jgi:signal transduction histidine kinase/ActR/RegA family two-component response regulator
MGHTGLEAVDALRAIQLLTDFAYLALGIAAIGAALRSRERAHVDVAILFGALAITTGLQAVGLLMCPTSLGCNGTPPLSTLLSTLLLLVVPYALLRLVDDVADIPNWQMRLALGLLIVLAAASIVAAGTPPAWLVLVLTLYVVVGSCYAAWAFARRAQATRGITHRRMAAVAWGCGLLVASIVLGVLGAVASDDGPLVTPVVRLSALISGLCFWAGFFPPNWLSQAWRLPELYGYLRPTRLMAAPEGAQGVATDAMAIERLCSATAATTGARRVLLIREDPAKNDLYIWGVPTARVPSDHPLMRQVFRAAGPLVLNEVTPDQLPEALAGVFTAGTLPRTAILAPISGDKHDVGILAAFAEKGPMFVEEDRAVVSFFAGEASAIMHMQQYRQSVSELEALREADRLKDEFMAVVSHELRTPLTAISGYADILLRRLSGPLNERQERQVTGVREAARRLLALINDLLDVSKLESGTLDLHPTALDPAGAIDRAVASVRVIGANKGVNVQARSPAKDLPAVCADDERLQQILSNLLTNALKFTPEGGSVWISADVEQGTSKPEIVFRVQDTGVGLAPGQESRIWDRFYQVESSATRRFGGAGLGLSIVRSLTEQQGGWVEASSAGVNLGSTFAVHLPTASSGDPALVAASPAWTGGGETSGLDPAPGPPVVLVVEDDAHIATVLRTYLEADGYRVEVAEDGQAAVVLAHALRPFAITLDISLPKLDGWSVLNVLKQDEATASIPVIVVSIVDNRAFGLVQGASEFLVKPIDPDRLRGAIDGVRPDAVPDKVGSRQS